jgi:hypothetical protein
MLQYSSERQTIQLVADRQYEEGEALTAWCGPQPNSRLLLNYGLVDEVSTTARHVSARVNLCRLVDVPMTR